MFDRGNEFMGSAMRALCQFHGIRVTTTASHSPHQNGRAERGHAVVDRAMERMLIAQPALKPAVALAWVIQAANTMQNVDGFSPFMLVFGRVPQHPSLVDVEPGNSEEVMDSQHKWVEQYKAMMSARESFAAAESDRVLRKALEQRIYSNHNNLEVGQWIYFKCNVDRSWQGPARLTLRDGKNLHLVKHGQPFVVNADDVLLNRPDLEQSTAQDFVTLPRPASTSPPTSSPAGHSYDVNPPVRNETESEDQGQNDVVQSQTTFSQPALPDQDQMRQHLNENNDVTSNNDVTGNNDVTQDQDQSQNPATSTSNSDKVSDLGEPMMCNLCQKEFSSLNIKEHIKQQHGIPCPNVRSLTTILDRRPDSLYENVDKLRPGVVMVGQEGDYVVLVKPTNEGWRVRSLNTKQEKDLELMKEMTEMRFVGDLEQQDSEGVYVTR